MGGVAGTGFRGKEGVECFAVGGEGDAGLGVRGVGWNVGWLLESIENFMQIILLLCEALHVGNKRMFQRSEVCRKLY